MKIRKRGKCDTPEYQSWNHAKQRCFNENDPSYFKYGGRGITMCEEWKNSFNHFLLDMGLRPSKNHSLDRKNNDGNYELNNCRWATPLQQANNTRKTLFVTHNEEKISIRELARKYSINIYTLRQRLVRDKMTLEEALTHVHDFNRGKKVIRKSAFSFIPIP